MLDLHAADLDYTVPSSSASVLEFCSNQRPGQDRLSTVSRFRHTQACLSLRFAYHQKGASWEQGKTCTDVHSVLVASQPHADLLALGDALLNESLRLPELAFKPPVKAHGAALRPAWQHYVGVHPWPISVDHEIGIQESISSCPSTCTVSCKACAAESAHATL